MKYVTQMDCRNKKGQNSAGCKVTSVQFIAMDNNNNGSIIKSPQPNLSSHASLRLPTRMASMRIDDPLGMKSGVNTDMFNKMLVTTNDSRIRLYNAEDYSLDQKFKSYTYRNTSMQIKASVSDNLKYIISGLYFIYTEDCICKEKSGAISRFCPFFSQKNFGK